MRFQLLGLAAVLAVGLAAPGVERLARAADVAAAARTFTMRLPGEPETLDWNRAHTTMETYMLMNLMEGLVGFDENLKVVPALARSWSISPDGKTYTFKLRPGVKWSDGMPLKAADFVFSWKRLLSPITAAPYAYVLFDVVGAEAFYKGTNHDFSTVGIQAPDDETIVVHLVQPVAHWIYIPTFWVTFPLRQDIVDQYGSGWETPGRMVTLGPYTLAIHDFDSKIVLKANPNYYGKRGNVDQITALIIRDDSTALSLYESGKLDFLTDISTLDLKRLSGRADLKRFHYLKTGYLTFLTSRYPVSNPKVRRAIAMAIDNSKLGETLHGGQEPAHSLVPPPLLGSSPRIGLPYDPKRAREILQSAGIDLTQPLRLDLLLPNWDKTLTMAQFFQAQLKQNLGIEVVLQPFDHKTFRAQLDLHTYPLFLGSWSADFPDPDNFTSVFLGISGNNKTQWKNQKYDDLVLAARKSPNPKEREKFYFQAQKILEETDAVVVPTYYEPIMALVSSRVQGLELNPLNYLYLKKVHLAH